MNQPLQRTHRLAQSQLDARRFLQERVTSYTQH
jgi:hypothetical protein